MKFSQTLSKPKRGRPTREILLFAQKAPGGVIRWGEAQHIYERECPTALRSYIGMNISRILKANFTKVEGTRGFYVMNHLICGDPTEESATDGTI